MINNRTVAAACLLGALDFFHYSVFSVFFTSYLQVAGNFPADAATIIEYELPSLLVCNVFLFSELIISLVTPSAWRFRLPVSSPLLSLNIPSALKSGY